MNFRRGIRRDEPEINFIPLIDVLLVILIFLMVTTTYSKFTELKVNLPGASAREADKRSEEIVVGVSANGQYRLAGSAEPLAPIALAAELRRRTADMKTPVLVVHADAAASHQAVIAVLDAARQVGLERITFAAESGTPR